MPPFPEPGSNKRRSCAISTTAPLSGSINSATTNNHVPSYLVVGQALYTRQKTFPWQLRLVQSKIFTGKGGFFAVKPL
jgi:hypothetical protein